MQAAAPVPPPPAPAPVPTVSYDAQPVIDIVQALLAKCASFNLLPIDKRKLDDVEKRAGILYAKLSTGEVSGAVFERLLPLCQGVCFSPTHLFHRVNAGLNGKHVVLFRSVGSGRFADCIGFSCSDYHNRLGGQWCMAYGDEAIDRNHLQAGRHTLSFTWLFVLCGIISASRLLSGSLAPFSELAKGQGAFSEECASRVKNEMNLVESPYQRILLGCINL